MQNLKVAGSVVRWLGSLAGSLAVGMALQVPAQAAGLVGTSVTVTLDSPTGITGDSTPVLLSDSVTVVSPGAEITAGDSTNIGGFMLTNVEQESIDIDAFTITLRLLTGDGVGTGFALGAQYVFSGLVIAGFDIVDASITANSGFSNFDAGWLGFDDATDVVSLAIDTMVFSGLSDATKFGDITITLQTREVCTPGTPGCGDDNGVPEPMSAALVGVALAAMVGTRRRQRVARVR